MDNQIEQLKKLKELLDAGILTQEEFDAKKKEVLGDNKVEAAAPAQNNTNIEPVAPAQPVNPQPEAQPQPQAGNYQAGQTFNPNDAPSPEGQPAKKKFNLDFKDKKTRIICIVVAVAVVCAGYFGLGGGSKTPFDSQFTYHMTYSEAKSEYSSSLIYSWDDELKISGDFNGISGKYFLYFNNDQLYKVAFEITDDDDSSFDSDRDTIKNYIAKKYKYNSSYESGYDYNVTVYTKGDKKILYELDDDYEWVDVDFYWSSSDESLD